MLLSDIIQQLYQLESPSSRRLEQLKRAFAKTTGRPCPTKIELLQTYRRLLSEKKLSPREDIATLLQTRHIRTLSGVAVIAVLMKPYPCPGDCLFCPSDKTVPKSYSPQEPAVMRALLCKFDPYKQVQMRLRALALTGHDTSKCELIIIGATFSGYQKSYQRHFIKRCFDACNGSNYNTLAASQKANENAHHRLVGISVETRPDTITPAEIRRLRTFGVTKVELGVQHTDDRVLTKNRRGHTVSQTITATRLLKDAGFKINYHIMPGLLGSDEKKDRAMFLELFTNPDFQPDMLKIYPCTVVANSDLYRLWKKRRYRPLSTSRLTKLLVQIKPRLPRYVRITRLIRDIPSAEIMGGSKVTNLRQDVQRELQSQGKKCLCIRCREARYQPARLSDVKLFCEEYPASGGTEFFLTYEDKKRTTLFAFARLRFPDRTFMPELANAALLRELHTYGQVVPIGQAGAAAQHLGLGRRLMTTAEQLARQAGYKKIAVISGVGVRAYYRKLGYRRRGTYMIKNLANAKN